MREGIVDTRDFEEYLRKNGYYAAAERIIDHLYPFNWFVYPYPVGDGIGDFAFIERINYGGNIMRVLEWERMAFAELVEKIDAVRKEYEVDGLRGKLGGCYQYALIESLALFSKFSEEIKKNPDYKPYIRERYPYEVCLNAPTITDYVCIIENSIQKPMRKSFDRFRAELIAKIAQQRNCPVTYLLYNDRIVYIIKRNEEVAYLKENYEERAGTALFDAIGSAIGYFEEEQKRSQEQKIKPLFLMYSDSLDTASKLFTKEQICALIKEAQDKGWQFAWEVRNWKNYKELTPYITYIDFTDPELPDLTDPLGIP